LAGVGLGCLFSRGGVGVCLLPFFPLLVKHQFWGEGGRGASALLLVCTLILYATPYRNNACMLFISILYIVCVIMSVRMQEQTFAMWFIFFNNACMYVYVSV
jgi:hypothetical protein